MPGRCSLDQTSEAQVGIHQYPSHGSHGPTQSMSHNFFQVLARGGMARAANGSSLGPFAWNHSCGQMESAPKEDLLSQTGPTDSRIWRCLVLFGTESPYFCLKDKEPFIDVDPYLQLAQAPSLEGHSF